ncbi:MAG: DUF4160 domain-containing protein [Beijerinckiaceae bacterium]
MTVIRLSGRLRVVIYPNDHRPAHVHVIGPDGEAVFNLNCPDGPPALRESFGFAMQDLNSIARELVATSISTLCESWRSIHGEP